MLIIQIRFPNGRGGPGTGRVPMHARIAKASQGLQMPACMPLPTPPIGQLPARNLVNIGAGLARIIR